ncbi:MAG TPA: IS607 family element RNA-guided endonuclease TnpB [Actinomycetes bacterium]
MLVTQAYRFALDPTPRQLRALWSHCGAARKAYNWALGLVRQRLDQRADGLELEVPWTLPALRREWNRAKDEVAPWWRENSKEAYNSGLDALARGLANWADSKHGRRKGRPVGFPTFKAKHRTRPTCRFWTGAIRVEPDRHHVTLPRIGRLKTHESTRKLARRLEAGTARILSATITCTADRWYVSFTVEVQRCVLEKRPGGAVVGMDVGIRHLAVLSTGQVVPNPRPLDHAQRRLRRFSRQLARRHGPRSPDGSRRTSSAGWRQTHRRLARMHARVANLRRDGLHKLTTELASNHGTVVVEHLNVASMLGNRRLARRIVDAGWGELRRQLAYKTAWAGTRLVQADTFYPSSRTCSGCGHVKAKLPLSERAYGCEQCGLVMDRDLNAARNLAQLVAGIEAVERAPHMVGAVAGSGPETRNARGADTRPGLAGQTATNREAGTGCRPG